MSENIPVEKEPKEMTDEELFDALREQVNLSRFKGGHQRQRTRKIAEACVDRGWKTFTNYKARTDGPA